MTRNVNSYKILVLSITLLACCFQYGFGQNSNDWAKDIKQLKTAGSVLFAGVSPSDFDRNAADYFLHTEKYRVGLLSLTRGENTDIDSLAYSLQGVQRGIYHVHKAVSKINQDYSDLYFTRAYDFLSNGREDSSYIFEKCWDAATIIGDIVWQIRTFRPDIILFPSYQYLPKSGKRFYALQMIKEAIRIAADSTFKEQFDGRPLSVEGRACIDGRFFERYIRIASCRRSIFEIRPPYGKSAEEKYNG